MAGVATNAEAAATAIVAASTFREVLSPRANISRLLGGLGNNFEQVACNRSAIAITLFLCDVLITTPAQTQNDRGASFFRLAIETPHRFEFFAISPRSSTSVFRRPQVDSRHRALLPAPSQGSQSAHDRQPPGQNHRALACRLTYRVMQVLRL